MKIEKKCPDRFSRPHYDHLCIKERCVAFCLIEVYDPPYIQLDSFLANPDSKLVAHTPWCKKYRARVGEDILIESEKS